VEKSLKQREQLRNFDGVSDDEAKRRSFLRTFTGRNVFPLELRVTDIHIEDIAQALSNLCRYNGHPIKFYSVAQHSVLVSQYLMNRYGQRHIGLSGLLHDAPEAYIGDMPTPLKRLLPGFVEAEDRIQTVVQEYFNLLYPLDCPEIKDADMKLLATEARDLMGNPKDWSSLKGLEPLQEQIICWPPETARTAFLKQYYALIST
jgi:uncharacterized protein